MPIISEYAGEEFQLAYVQRGDLVETTNFSARYSSVRQESVAFGVSDVPYDELFISVGDVVEAGQLLGQLDMGDLHEQLEAARDEAERLRLSIRQTEQDRDYAMEEQRIRLSFIEDEEELEKADTVEDVAAPYEKALRETQDALRVANLKVERLESQTAERELRSTLSGVVSYVKRYDEKTVSRKDERVATISDLGSSMFVIEAGADAGLFTPGEWVDVQLTGGVCPCLVCEAAELNGIEVQEGFVYLKPSQADQLTLENNARGSVLVEVDRRNDCLYINEKAVRTLDGESFVYFQDDNGMRKMHPIKTGFAAGGFVQVLEGLDEGDAVILN